MEKGESLQKSRPRSQAKAEYNEIKEIITIARKNGWDLEGLGLIPKDLPKQEPVSLTKKQVTERNRLVKSILKRFSTILQPPVPLEVEEFIKSKPTTEWLPWEEEALGKVEQWRREVNEVKPAILMELRRAILSGSDPA